MAEVCSSLADLCSSLGACGHTAKLYGLSAIDRYLGLPNLPFLWLETSADIAVLARHTENLRFPGVRIADGAAELQEGTCYFHCLDTNEKCQASFPLLSFAYDYSSRRFHDPLGVYPQLKALLQKSPHEIDGKNEISFDPKKNQCKNASYKFIMDAALLKARYGFSSQTFVEWENDGRKTHIADIVFPAEVPPEPETQRVFLSCLMLSPRPERGLELLKRSGFLGEIWPELASLNEVDHSKEFHPEGNVWNHTLETFRYRKPNAAGAFDLRLSLGLLLHDAGKPVSASFGNHRFDGHAELGARTASRFLERLGFEPALILDVSYLVKNHMLPAALKRLPLSKTEEIMTSPLFPTLMELYRCDESSSFKGLDNFYENSAAYQSYLKNLKNPYRSADGKKLKRSGL